MDLLQNPFHLLAASTRDNRRRIMELADERSLLLDSSDLMEARSDLTTPRKRLSAEVAWLPGIGPKRTGEALSVLESRPTALLSVNSLPPIARTNLLAAALTRLSSLNADKVTEWILEISWEVENIMPEELLVIINEERVASGFPELFDLSAVEEEIDNRRKYYRKVIKSALNALPPKELVKAVTVAVDSATNNGEEHGPILISDLVDLYEIEAQGFLQKEEENIKKLVERLRTAVDAKVQDSIITSMVNQLIQVVKNWDTVAQPIQVSRKSRGLNHAASQSIASMVRSLGIYMFNEHDKLNFSHQITQMLQEVFAEVGDIAERTSEDAEALERITEQRVRLLEDEKNKAEKWRREVTYETDVGTIFKGKLRISPEGVEWKGSCWTLDSISRIRWGGTRHSVNGIPTGVTYKIFFGNGSKYESIEVKNESIYNNFVGCLWKTVGVRLLNEYLQGLREGKEYYFGTAILNDQGIILERKKIFGRRERVFCRWSELVIWNGAGTFSIRKNDEQNLSISLSYQDDDNTHVLEAAIRMFWKRRGDRLSSLLGD